MLEAKSGHEAIIAQARKLWVIKNGCAVAVDGRPLVDSRGLGAPTGLSSIGANTYGTQGLTLTEELNAQERWEDV